MRIKKVEAFPVRLPRDWDSALGMAGSPNELAAGKAITAGQEHHPALYSTTSRPRL